jgi:DNA repair exonuclease SbcCD nuclease subunit
MTRIAMITDTHWGVRNDSSVFYDYFQRSLVDFFHVLDTFQIKHVIHLGDIFDRRKYINYHTAYRCRKDFIEPLEERGIETHIIGGNHDQYYKNTHSINSLDELIGTRYNHIHTYMEPSIINIDGTDIQLLPWVTESNYAASNKAVSQPKASILMGHLEVQGFEQHKGHVSNDGWEIGRFANFDLVYSGHYHHRSRIDNVVYLGAFAEHTWSDFQDPRGFTTLDLTTREETFHQNRNHIFNMVTYDDVKDSDILKVINEKDFSKFANTYVKILVVNKTNPYAFDLFFDKLEKVEPLNIRVVEDGITTLDDIESEIDEAEDTPTILSKYIDSLKLPVDSEKMKGYLKGIYQEALNLENYE